MAGVRVRSISRARRCASVADSAMGFSTSSGRPAWAARMLSAGR
jgi:hypothetical protein